jgi:transaldolase
MELYLDSANVREIEAGAKLGILRGLTTTPTFMQREGVTDIDGMIVKLSKIVPILQIEALGDTAEDILAEAQRQLKLGLNPKKTVFKIPISLEGVRACRMLRNKGLQVNMHLVYTLQQAYMAMCAGATYVCPLVGRLQDQGHDALALVEQCVEAVRRYGYDTKIMFSSVRHVEHVRNAINLGVHAITIPLKVLTALTENHFTALGTQQFVRDTRMMTVRVKDAMRNVNPIVLSNISLAEALVKMTEYGFGAVTVMNTNGTVRGIFTDGDLRRQIQANGQAVLKKKMRDFSYRSPVAIEAGALLNDAAELFKSTKVDTLLVREKGRWIGMLDIQNLEI